MADDRYPVDPLNGNAGLAEYLRELERRLAELEAARPLGNTTLQDGTFRVVDDNGDLRAQVGKLGNTGTWGIEVIAQPGNDNYPDGKPYFRANDNGIEFPYGYSAWLKSGELNTFTNASFETKWEAGLGIVSQKYLGTLVYAGTDAGTVGELRLSGYGGAVSTVVQIPAGTSSTLWQLGPFLHGYALWTGPALFGLQVRRVSGAGNVNVYTPVYGAHFVPR